MKLGLGNDRKHPPDTVTFSGLRTVSIAPETETYLPALKFDCLISIRNTIRQMRLIGARVRQSDVG